MDRFTRFTFSSPINLPCNCM
ncbi:hypothetical protein AB6A40_001215 [Gnathostoma spinigerum]|uniref:Uncharacterized protein n=1 Tax=Gnathostoma spinigerum TaxID=75299 RepID=A0ABD6E5W3_9BILA